MSSFSKEINLALDRLLSNDKDVILMGQDIEDPFGGCFKITKGLFTKYPEQVFNTPIAEASLTGIAIGMALNGKKPILEIMFSDFLTLCADQIINHASVFRTVFDKPLPMIIRTVSGPGNGYGPTHSKALESLFYNIPNVKIVSPSNYHDVESLMELSLYDNDLVIWVEDKRLYSKKMLNRKQEYMLWLNELLLDPDIEIITHGYLTFEADLVVSELSDKGIKINVISDTILNRECRYRLYRDKDPKYLIVSESDEFIDRRLEIYNNPHVLRTPNKVISDNKEKEKELVITKDDIIKKVLEIL